MWNVFSINFFTSHRQKVERVLDWLIVQERKICHSYVDKRLSEHCRVRDLAWKWRKLIHLTDSEKICLKFECFSETEAQRRVWHCPRSQACKELLGFRKLLASCSEPSEFIIFSVVQLLFSWVKKAIFPRPISLLRISGNPRDHNDWWSACVDWWIDLAHNWISNFFAKRKQLSLEFLNRFVMPLVTFCQNKMMHDRKTALCVSKFQLNSCRHLNLKWIHGAKWTQIVVLLKFWQNCLLVKLRPWWAVWVKSA